MNARAYTVADICEKLHMSRSTFFALRKAKELPFLEEIQPRLGRIVRYRADLVDRFLAGEWGSSGRRYFRKAS